MTKQKLYCPEKTGTFVMMFGFKQPSNFIKNLWTWNRGKNENFTCIYKNYNDNLTIYTPVQLLELLEDVN